MKHRREYILRYLTLYLAMGVQSFYYGGQAVLRGVMMRGRNEAWVVVQDEEGVLHEQSRALDFAWLKNPFLKLPLSRGIVALVQSLWLGVWALGYSSTVAYPEDEALDTKGVILSMVLAFVFAVGLFVALPFEVSRVLEGWTSGWLQTALEGAFRVGVLIAYMALIGKNREIGEVFECHGAEHKAINAFEQQLKNNIVSRQNDIEHLLQSEKQTAEELEVEQVMEASRVHDRCGTSFLVIVALLSIIVYSLISRPTEWVYSLGLRVVLIPVIGAIAYEIIRFNAGHSCNPVVRTIAKPGIWVQGLTTREPSAEQARIALFALRRAIH